MVLDTQGKIYWVSEENAQARFYKKVDYEKVEKGDIVITKWMATLWKYEIPG